jgi:hypothetical protein
MIEHHHHSTTIGNIECDIHIIETKGYIGDYYNEPEPSEFTIDSIYAVDYSREILPLLNQDTINLIINNLRYHL